MQCCAGRNSWRASCTPPPKQPTRTASTCAPRKSWMPTWLASGRLTARWPRFEPPFVLLMTREVVNREGRSPHWPEAGRDEGGDCRCCFRKSWTHALLLDAWSGTHQGALYRRLDPFSGGGICLCVSVHKQAESYGSARLTVPSFQMFLRKGMRGRCLDRWPIRHLSRRTWPAQTSHGLSTC